LSSDSESRRVRTGDHVNGSQSRLRSTSTASSYSEVVSSSSNVERELVSNSILARVLSNRLVSLTVVSFNLISDSIVLNSVVPLKSNRVSILDSIEASDRSRSYWKADSSLVSLLNRVSSKANAVTCSDLDLDEVSRSNVVLSKLLSTERARVFVDSLSTNFVGEASYCAVDVAAREDNPLVIVAKVVDRLSSHVYFILSNWRANRGSFSPAESKVALVNVDTSKRSRRRGKSHDRDFHNVRSNSTASLAVSCRDLDSIERGVRGNLNSERSLVEVSTLDKVLDRTLASVLINVHLVSGVRSGVPSDSELVSLNATRGVTLRSDSSGSRSESSSGNLSSRSLLTVAVNSETSNFNHIVSNNLVVNVSLVEALVDLLDGGLALESVELLVNSVVDGSTRLGDSVPLRSSRASTKLTLTTKLLLTM
jgi:hypothetical protein